MNVIIKRFVLFLLVLLISTPVHAAAPQWDVDPAHTNIYFTVKHIYSSVRGYFPEFNGVVMFSPDDLAGSRFDFEVNVKSINTGNSKRDGHLNSADFFDSGKYPKMTFKSTAIQHVREDQYVVEGRLTVKDVTQTVAVPFTFMGVTPNPFDKQSEVAGFEARITIDRLAYHVGDGRFYNMGVVGKDVDVLITMEVTRKK